MTSPELDALLHKIVEHINNINKHLDILGQRLVNDENEIRQGFTHIESRFKGIENSIGDLYLTGRKKEE